MLVIASPVGLNFSPPKSFQSGTREEELGMFRATYFVQACPICGRNLQVRLEYLGRTILCPHCNGQFVGSDPATEPANSSDSGEYLLNRADELLSSVGSTIRRPR